MTNASHLCLGTVELVVLELAVPIPPPRLARDGGEHDGPAAPFVIGSEQARFKLLDQLVNGGRVAFDAFSVIKRSIGMQAGIKEGNGNPSAFEIFRRNFTQRTRGLILIQERTKPFDSLFFGGWNGRNLKWNDLVNGNGSTEELLHFFTDCFRDQWWHGIPDQPELVRARDGKVKPVRKTLNTRGFTGSERTVLCRVYEAESVLAQVRDDGGAKFLAMLALVAVGEASPIVEEFHFHTACFGFAAVFSFAQAGKIPQIFLVVRAGTMGGKSWCLANLQNGFEVVRCPPPRAAT